MGTSGPTWNRGASDTQSITDDFEISKVVFRLDSLTHTHVGDMTVGLKGPSGYGATQTPSGP